MNPQLTWMGDFNGILDKNWDTTRISSRHLETCAGTKVARGISRSLRQRGAFDFTVEVETILLHKPGKDVSECVLYWLFGTFDEYRREDSW